MTGRASDRRGEEERQRGKEEERAALTRSSLCCLLSIALTLSSLLSISVQMSQMKQRKAAAAAASSASSSVDVPSVSSVASPAVLSQLVSPSHTHSQSSYDYIPHVGSAREVATARANASKSNTGLLAGFSGGSEFVFQAAILLAICVLAFMVRLFSVVRYESVIHEFDPWFNFRTTRYLVEEGFYAFHNC